MTPFARKVYRVVARIPLGKTRTYKWVAQKAGRPNAYRAVGTILKNNPWPLFIPCHRVIKSDKILGGYVFGKKVKKDILSLEMDLRDCLMNKE
jgi:O-6-methylguanine DNA methyltransferase